MHQGRDSVVLQKLGPEAVRSASAACYIRSRIRIYKCTHFLVGIIAHAHWSTRPWQVSHPLAPRLILLPLQVFPMKGAVFFHTALGGTVFVLA